MKYTKYKMCSELLNDKGVLRIVKYKRKKHIRSFEFIKGKYGTTCYFD